MRLFITVLHILCCTSRAELQIPSDESNNVQEVENSDEVCLLQKRDSYVSSLREASQTSLSSNYPWSMRGGDKETSSSSSATAPTDFSNGRIVWHNSRDEEVRHSPLIDDESNIYIMTTTHVRKVDPEGNLKWNFSVPEADGSMRCSPALYDGALYAVASNSSAAATWKIDMNSGRVLWKSVQPRIMSGDSQAVLAFNDMVIIPTLVNTTHAGSDSLLAMTTSDGSLLWEYTTDDVFWNFKPSATTDGSIIFSSSCGAVHRIDGEGKLIWKKPALSHVDERGFCSMGGGSVGPNGVFYAEHGDRLDNASYAYINAYNISTGENIWSKNFTEFGGQYPSVGVINGGVVVVAPIGSSLSVDPIGVTIHDPSKFLVNSVVAMNADNGHVLWRFEEKPWNHPGADGDYGVDIARRTIEKLLGRFPEIAPSIAADVDPPGLRKFVPGVNPRREVICLPDPQGIPVISGDGYVYASSSHNGNLYAIKDVDGDGIINKDVAGEVSTFETNECFLNSPSLGPGILVAAPCWGPVYIFKS